MTRQGGPTLFTPADRRGVLDQLVALATSDAAILGTLLVGSGSEGFGDDYSDLDVVFVAEPARFADVLESTRRFIGQRLRPVFLTTYQHLDDVFVHCLLLENRLNVDIGVWSGDALFASSPKWRLVQSRDPRAAESISQWMATRLRPERPYPPIVTGDEPTWQSVYRAFITEMRAGAAPADPFSSGQS